MNADSMEVVISVTELESWQNVIPLKWQNTEQLFTELAPWPIQSENRHHTGTKRYFTHAAAGTKKNSTD